MMSANNPKVQCTIDQYTDFVIDGLITVKGTSRSDVASYILKSWIDMNISLLTEYQLSYSHWSDAKENEKEQQEEK